jgi:hypothetical protein
MSVTKHIACKTCRKYLWIGQANYLYTGDPGTMENLRKFLLVDHVSSTHDHHDLVSTDEHELVMGVLEGYEEVK